MNRNNFFIYPKDKDGKKIGNCIYVTQKPEGIFFGEAILSKKDQFVYKIGRQLAMERAEESYQKYISRINKNP
jgi:hypothetical protein